MNILLNYLKNRKFKNDENNNNYLNDKKIKNNNICFLCNKENKYIIYFYNDNRYCSESCRLNQMHIDKYI